MPGNEPPRKPRASKQLSSPIATGGGGHTFEVHVQAAFVALLLSRRLCPLPSHLAYPADQTPGARGRLGNR